MTQSSLMPVYINYGQNNFLKTYYRFKSFLKTVPFEKLRFQNNSHQSAGIIVSPRNNSGIPWCNLTIALLYAYKQVPFRIILDDLNFLDPQWKEQLMAVEELVDHICNKLNISYLKTSLQADTGLDGFDYEEIKRLSAVNGIWNVRSVIPSEELNQYIELSYVALEKNAKKIKGLYASNSFDHCVHQSLVNNNGGLHKWFGGKFGTRVGCIDMSMGRGLVGLKDVAGYHLDLPDIIEDHMPEFLDSEEQRQIAISEALNEHKLRKQGKDSKAYQIVSTKESSTPIEVDILLPVNILWDAASLGKNRFFDSPLCWLEETIAFCLAQTTARIVVRQHPAERRFEIYGTGTKLGEYLNSRFGNQSRFRFISCNDSINTYLLIENCKVVLPYTSTVGIEAAMMGKKVIIESSVYYKDQPFVQQATSKEDYFEKIKNAYEEFGTSNQGRMLCKGDENGWLLYFLLNRCNVVFSDFGLEPSDFEKWTVKGFDSLSRDENLITAIEAMISNKPYAYINGKKILKRLKNQKNRIIELPSDKNREIIFKLNQIIFNINSNRYKEALRIIESENDCAEIYMYPKAFVLARLNRFDEALRVLKKFNILKPEHQYSRFLEDELVAQINKASGRNNPEEIEKRVIGIVSPSYSGSTLLAAILGAHSKILAAGEVRWLIEKDYFNVKQMIIKTADLSKMKDTPWQDNLFTNVTYRNLYETIFKVFKKNYIVDSSKDINHFKNMTLNNSRSDISFIFFFIIKHPVRLLSSHLMHRWDKWENLKNYNRNDAINYLINDIDNNLTNIVRRLKEFEKDYKIITVKYEDLVNDSAGLIKDLLSEISLNYEPGMENYYEKEQFILGGNAGPRYHIAKAQKGIEKDIQNPIQKEFYKTKQGISMDNNFRKVFSISEIANLYKNEKIRNLMNIFGYQQIE